MTEQEFMRRAVELFPVNYIVKSINLERKFKNHGNRARFQPVLEHISITVFYRKRTSSSVQNMSAWTHSWDKTHDFPTLMEDFRKRINEIFHETDKS